MRVGIGRPNNRKHVTEYVLSKFEPSEVPVMKRTIEQCCKVLMNELQLCRAQDSAHKDTKDTDESTVQFQAQQKSVV